MVAMVVHDTTTIGDAIAIVYDALLQLLYAAEEAAKLVLFRGYN